MFVDWVDNLWLCIYHISFIGVMPKKHSFIFVFQHCQPILNQYSRSSKSLNSLKNLFFELNAFLIFESPKICNALQRIALAQRWRSEGVAGAQGGMALSVYGLVQKSGKIDLLTKAGLQQRPHTSKTIRDRSTMTICTVLCI